jgi:hypothetical protein
LVFFPIFIILEILSILLVEKKIISSILFFIDRNNIFLGLLLVDYFILLFLGNIKIGFLDTNKLLLILFKF